MPIPNLPQFSDEQLFQACNVVLPCWVMLMILPKSKLTQVLVMFSSMFLCMLYAGLALPMLVEGKLNFSDFMSLQGVARLMSNYRAVLPSWVHFSVADLWVGHWVALNGCERRVPRILMAPILFACMMLGPVGLGSYFLLRMFRKGPSRHKRE